MDIRAVRELETWTPGNIVGGIVLAVALVVLIVWLVRRFLSD
jgi:flagellar biogenesis protein FliO